MPGAVLVATAACTKAPPSPDGKRPRDIVAVVRADMARTAALPGRIECQWHGNDPRDDKDIVAGYFCSQSFWLDRKRGLGVGVTVKAAKGDKPEPGPVAFGPGGSAFSSTRRTRDGRYDVRADQAMTGLLKTQTPTLPEPDALLDRVLAAYDGAP